MNVWESNSATVVTSYPGMETSVIGSSKKAAYPMLTTDLAKGIKSVNNMLLSLRFISKDLIKC